MLRRTPQLFALEDISFSGILLVINFLLPFFHPIQLHENTFFFLLHENTLKKFPVILNLPQMKTDQYYLVKLFSHPPHLVCFDSFLFIYIRDKNETRLSKCLVSFSVKTMLQRAITKVRKLTPNPNMPKKQGQLQDNSGPSAS